MRNTRAFHVTADELGPGELRPIALRDKVSKDCNALTETPALMCDGKFADTSDPAVVAFLELWDEHLFRELADDEPPDTE